jgi:hypothetical protein
MGKCNIHKDKEFRSLEEVAGYFFLLVLNAVVKNEIIYDPWILFTDAAKDQMAQGATKLLLDYHNKEKKDYLVEILELLDVKDLGHTEMVLAIFYKSGTLRSWFRLGFATI